MISVIIPVYNSEKYLKATIQSVIEQDYRDIEITFTRNLPANTDEIVNVINNAGHLLSKETQLALLPYDLDVEKEIERKNAEDEAAYDNYAELRHDDTE